MTAVTIVWEHHKQFVDDAGEVWECLLSGEVPKTPGTVGDPVVPWIKLGIDDGQIHQRTSVSPMHFLEQYPTTPPTLGTVRVVVRAGDWAAVCPKSRPGAVLPKPPGSGSSGGSSARPSIPEWPLTCPRCGRANSAVALFISYDCRHGCFGSKRGGVL